MVPPAICKYCDQVIFGKTQYWHYWDLETRNFLCTSLDTIDHPYHPKQDGSDASGGHCGAS